MVLNSVTIEADPTKRQQLSQPCFNATEEHKPATSRRAP